MKNFKKSAIVLIGTLGGLSAQAADSVLEMRLDALERRSNPSQLRSEATCYMVAALPKNSAYMCPVCGQKTLYAKWDAVRLIEHELPDIRKKVKTWKSLGFHVAVDERCFCASCDPQKVHHVADSSVLGQKKNVPALFFVITHSDSTRVRTFLSDPEQDIAVLDAFFTENDKVNLEQLGEEPLKDYLPRLRELLGVSESESESGWLKRAGEAVESFVKWECGDGTEKEFGEK